MQQGQHGGEPVGVGVILGWQEDKGSSATGRVVVDAVAHGWPASLCGKMAVGDTILAVDSTDVATAIAPFEQVGGAINGSFREIDRKWHGKSSCCRHPRRHRLCVTARISTSAPNDSMTLGRVSFQIPDKLSAVRELIVGEQDTLVSFKLRLINGKTRCICGPFASDLHPQPNVAQAQKRRSTDVPRDHSKSLGPEILPPNLTISLLPRRRIVKMVRFSAAASSQGSPSASKHASIGVLVDSACTVTSIAKGGAARLCGGIYVGDIITSVDGIDFSHGSQAGEGNRPTLALYDTPKF